MPTQNNTARAINHRTIAPILVTAVNAVLWALYGLGDVFVAISGATHANVGIAWFSASAVCALVAALALLLLCLQGYVRLLEIVIVSDRGHAHRSR